MLVHLREQLISSNKDNCSSVVFLFCEAADVLVGSG